MRINQTKSIGNSHTYIWLMMEFLGAMTQGFSWVKMIHILVVK